MNKDQLVLEEMYMQMYDEGWKSKALGGLGALGAAGALGYAAMKPIPAIPHMPSTSQVAHSSPYKPTFDSARSDRDLRKLIRDYYNSKGHDVEVSIMGDDVDIFDRKKNKTITFPLEELKGSIKMGQDENDPSMPQKYLNTWLN